MTHVNSTPLILFATSPALDQLQALTIVVPDQIQAASRLQPQIIKCREIIFTEPEVIGTPGVEINDHCFHLIAQAPLLKSGKLQRRLSSTGLKVSSPYEVSPQLYQSCLQYTLTARLSPTWNKAGQWLIQGRDFLVLRGCANAVKMSVTVTQDELFFTLEATAVKLIPLQVTDLDIEGKHLNNFLSDNHTTIAYDFIASDWCFVMPSMKRGRIVSISHEIPEESPFTTYRDMKRHWKNMYGYRLPDTDEKMNFYQIQFGPIRGKLFTYPEVCLRGRELQVVTRVDPKPILRTFILDVQKKMPTVCGMPMKLQSKAKFVVQDLLISHQTGSQPNLTSKMSSRPPVYRTPAEMERLYTQHTSGPCVTSHEGAAQSQASAYGLGPATASDGVKGLSSTVPSSADSNSVQQSVARKLFPVFHTKKQTPAGNKQKAESRVPAASVTKRSFTSHIADTPGPKSYPANTPTTGAEVESCNTSVPGSQRTKSCVPQSMGTCSKNSDSSRPGLDEMGKKAKRTRNEKMTSHVLESKKAKRLQKAEA